MAVFDEPFDEAREAGVRALDGREDALRLREDEAAARPRDAVALFGLLREVEASLPFELPDVVFLLLWDRELVWAMSPP